jgi:prepilin-type N-terminal cleavage/methylation domain-containing protein
MPASIKKRKRKGDRGGFSLTELMMALGIMGLVMAGGTVVYLMSQRLFHQTSAISKAYVGASTVIQRMIAGVGTGYGVRGALPSLAVVTENDGWSMTYEAPSAPSGFGTEKHYLRYQAPRGVIEYSRDSMDGQWALIGKNIMDSEAERDDEHLYLSVAMRVGAGRDMAISSMGTTVRIRNANY